MSTLVPARRAADVVDPRPGVDPVDAFVRALAHRLTGPWRVRAGMIREVRHGLEDAEQAYVADGATRAEARRAAVDEFGDVDEIAAGLQPELALSQARRTAAATALLFPAVWIAWDLTWQRADLAAAPTTIAVLARLTDVIGLSTAFVCLVALVALELVGRRVRRPERAVRAIATVVATGILGVLTSSATMTALNSGGIAAVSSGDSSGLYTAVCLASLGSAGWVLWSASRCFRATGRPASA